MNIPTWLEENAPELVARVKDAAGSWAAYLAGRLKTAVAAVSFALLALAEYFGGWITAGYAWLTQAEGWLDRVRTLLGVLLVSFLVGGCAALVETYDRAIAVDQAVTAETSAAVLAAEDLTGPAFGGLEIETAAGAVDVFGRPFVPGFGTCTTALQTDAAVREGRINDLWRPMITGQLAACRDNPATAPLLVIVD